MENEIMERNGPNIPPMPVNGMIPNMDSINQGTIRQKVVDTALSLLSIKEGTAEHKHLVDTYNSQDKLPRGYRLKDTDAWCAAFVSVIGILLDISHILLPEVGCSKMIELYKAQGRWEEWDAWVPRPGDLIMYDWDAQQGECTGAPDHVGMVVSVSGETITVVEGNYDNQVKIRKICVEYIKIRGYCLPNYSALVQWFSDVPLNAWCKDEIYRARELGLMQGIGGGLFEPDRPVTRAELAAVAVRLHDQLKK